MPIETLERDFRKKFAENIQFLKEDDNRFRVSTPFRFDDGDHLVIVLKKEENSWMLSDEAHTYMRLTYDIKESDLHRGSRQKIISNALSEFQIEDRDGELLLRLSEDDNGEALYSFAQAILKISDISFLSRERIRSMFKEEFKQLLAEIISKDRLTFDWAHPDYDPYGNYVVDCRINSIPRPLFVQALASDSTTRDATIVLLQFEKWEVPFRSLAIFEDQENISRKVLARFTDICEKQYSSLAANRERISRYLLDSIQT